MVNYQISGFYRIFNVITDSYKAQPVVRFKDD